MARIEAELEPPQPHELAGRPEANTGVRSRRYSNGPPGGGAMSPLQCATRAALAGAGALAAADPHHTERCEQLEMAAAVAHAIDQRAPLVVERGGRGEDLCLPRPALLVGARTLLSTATKTLQDQLFLRDLPRLRNALGVPVTIAY